MTFDAGLAGMEIRRVLGRGRLTGDIPSIFQTVD
jgi:hypothetical protein